MKGYNVIWFKRNHCRSNSFFLLSMLVILVLMAVAGCYRISPENVKPFPLIDPSYYNCIEVKPGDLCDAYYTRYSQIAEAQYRYDSLFFVFKDIEVTDAMFKHIDENYLWVEGLIRCYCLDIKEIEKYKIRDRVDIVGKNKGVVMGVSGLTFIDCIILPAGSLQMPAQAGGESVIIY